MAAGRADAGGPEPIRDRLPGVFDRDIDAVCVWPPGTPFEGKVRVCVLLSLPLSLSLLYVCNMNVCVCVQY